MKKAWLIAAVLLLATAWAAADGGFFVKVGVSGRLVTQPRQEAVLVRDGGDVVVVVRTAYEGDVDELAWVYPVPAVPKTVEKADDVMFERLDRETAPAFAYPGHGGGFVPCFACAAGGKAGVENRSAAGSLVRVEAEGVAGMVEWKCLSSGGADALLTWLVDNKYAVPAKSRDALQQYIDRRMFFLAFKVRADRREGRQTAVHPVLFRYASAAFEFPMVISAPTAAAQTEVLLYVVGSTAYDVAGFATFSVPPDQVKRDPASRSGTTYEKVFLQRVADANGRAFCREAVQPLSWGFADTFGPLLRPQSTDDEWDEAVRGFYITRLRTVLTPAQMDRDLVLAAGEQKPAGERLMYWISRADAGGDAARFAAAGVQFTAVLVGAVLSIQLVSRRRRRWWHAAGAAAGVATAVLLLALL